MLGAIIKVQLDAKQSRNHWDLVPLLFQSNRELFSDLVPNRARFVQEKVRMDQCLDDKAEADEENYFVYSAHHQGKPFADTSV